MIFPILGSMNPSYIFRVHQGTVWLKKNVAFSDLTAGISSFGDFHLPSQPGTSDSVAPFATWGEAPSKDFLLAPKT